MNIINRARGTDKTTSLIYTSYVTGYPIVTCSAQRVNNIKHMAEEMQVKVNAFSVHDWQTYMKRCYPDGHVLIDDPDGHVLIDDADAILEAALSAFLGGANIMACTMAIPCIDRQIKNQAAEEKNGKGEE